MQLDHVSQDAVQAGSFLKKRVRRNNKDTFEEMQSASLERECIEEVCSAEELAEVFERSKSDPAALSTPNMDKDKILAELKRLKSLSMDRYLRKDISSGDCDGDCQIMYNLMDQPCEQPDTVLLNQPHQCNAEGTVRCSPGWGERECICKEGYGEKRNGSLTCEKKTSIEVGAVKVESSTFLVVVSIGGTVLLLLLGLLGFYCWRRSRARTSSREAALETQQLTPFKSGTVDTKRSDKILPDNAPPVLPRKPGKDIIVIDLEKKLEQTPTASGAAIPGIDANHSGKMMPDNVPPALPSKSGRDVIRIDLENQSGQTPTASGVAIPGGSAKM